MKSIDGSESDHQILKWKKSQPTSISAHTISSKIYIYTEIVFRNAFSSVEKNLHFFLFLFGVSFILNGKRWNVACFFCRSDTDRDERSLTHTHTYSRSHVFVNKRTINWMEMTLNFMHVHICLYLEQLSLRHSNESLAENIHTHTRTYAYAPIETASKGVKDLHFKWNLFLVGV